MFFLCRGGGRFDIIGTLRVGHCVRVRLRQGGDSGGSTHHVYRCNVSHGPRACRVPSDRCFRYHDLGGTVRSVAGRVAGLDGRVRDLGGMPCSTHRVVGDCRDVVLGLEGRGRGVRRRLRGGLGR